MLAENQRRFVNRHPETVDQNPVGQVSIGFEAPAHGGCVAASQRTLDPPNDESGCNSLESQFVSAIEHGDRSLGIFRRDIPP